MARGLQIIQDDMVEEDSEVSMNDIVIVQPRPSNQQLPRQEQNSTTSSSYSAIIPRLPYQRPEPTLQETRTAGQVLFTQFFRQNIPSDVELDIVHDAIPSDVPTDIQNTMQSVSRNLDGYASPSMADMGRDLRSIAVQFEQSRERQEIRQRAASVSLENINYDDFRSLLVSFFADGNFSRSRIIVLFCFCSDLALKAYQSGSPRLVCQLFTWSVAFIMDGVCNWVQNQGGWSVVLGDYLPRFAVTACAVLGCVAFAIYINRSLSISS